MNEQELINYYNKFNEDKRLNTKHAQVEFLTAMKYIKDYLKKGDKILDIGAGCGKYSITLSEMGNDVTNASQNWKNTVCEEHEKEMISILYDSCYSENQ